MVEDDGKIEFEKALKYSEIDNKKFIKYLKKSTRKHYPPSFLQVHLKYKENNCFEHKIFDDWPTKLYNSFPWFVKQVEIKGDSFSYYNLALCYHFGLGTNSNLSKALYLFEKSAETEYLNAIYCIGVCYEKGLGIKKNRKLSILSYTRAANKGHIQSQNKLGIIYTQGCIANQDFKKAVFWFKKGVKKGNYICKNNLGACYFSGNGVKKDTKKGIFFIRESAKQGYSTARSHIATCYDSGIYVKKGKNNYYFYNLIQFRYKSSYLLV
jgi:TPR repeat protein